MPFIMSMFSGIGLKVMAGLAIVGAILAILAGAKSAGRKAERVDAMKRTIKSVETRNEVEREVMRLGGDVAHERLLDKWTRD